MRVMAGATTLGDLASALAIRSQESAIVAELKASAAEGHLAVPLEELALSYIHMHANRLLRSAQRQQELVLYDFLARIYESRVARAASAS